MKDSASSRITSDDSEAFFEWLRFDGDDCFSEFHIDIVSGIETRRFEFGPCVISGLRKPVRFLRGDLDTTSSGFQFPDIRTYGFTRSEDGFLLQIRFEGSGMSEQFFFGKPSLSIDDELLREYDSES
jgi:hypothetical protein